MTPLRYHLAVPALDIVRRGGTDPPRDLPVAFLRWWIFAPFDGILFGAAAPGSRPGAPIWLLRDGGAIVDVRLSSCALGRLITATRRAEGRAERIDQCSSGAGVAAGDRVRYRDENVGLEVDLQIESISAGAPDAAAFRDPDEDNRP